MKSWLYSIVLLPCTVWFPQVSFAETLFVKGPLNSSMSLDATCAERNQTEDISTARLATSPVWLECEVEGKRTTLLMAGFSRILDNANDFQSDKADNIFEEITRDSELHQLRHRAWFFGGITQGRVPVASLTVTGWICPDEKRRCGKPEKVIDLKVVGSRSATIALLAIGDFNTTELKTDDAKFLGVRWDLPDSVRSMIDTFDFGK